ncbi:MAG: DotH/IcmK family type IV secretion protein [Gammaproteobacteria bacterium]
MTNLSVRQVCKIASLWIAMLSAMPATVFAQDAASLPNQPASIDQFQQWLQSNTTTTTTTTTSSSDAPAVIVQSAPIRAKHIRRTPRPLTYEQGQLEMRQAVPPTSPRPTPEATAAFNAMLQQNMPLTPQQVVQLHQQIDMSQRAASIPANIPPKPVSSTIMVNLAPGTTPPAVRLAQGYVSSLVFIDSTGSPWPIASFDIGNPKAVNIQWDGKSNVLLLQAVAAYSDGNIVVKLVGMPTPITLELVAGQRVVDYRADIHVSGIGPNTKDIPMGTPLPNSANQLLLGVLDGIAPAGSKPLIVPGADNQAWLLGDKMYLRTRFTVLSPGWVGKMVSPDGMIAYEMPKTSSILISRYGEPVELKVEGI